MDSLRPRIGVSACLLGHRVRHDGGDKHQDWLIEILGPWVQWVPTCPEMEMGLGAPRESMRIIKSPEGERLVGNKTQTDFTQLAVRTSSRVVSRFKDLDGFVLKKDSPSCGLERVKVYGRGGIPSRSTSGFFARQLREAFPFLPVIEEGRLNDLAQRDHFLMQIFTHCRWRQTPSRVAALQAFHQRHKLLILAHHPVLYRELGRLVATASDISLARTCELYRETLMKALQKPSTPSKRVNVLQHAIGYFKKHINAADKAQILSVLEDYRQGDVPLAAPAALIDHLIKKFSMSYLADQFFFEPFPKKLGSRRT